MSTSTNKNIQSIYGNNYLAYIDGIRSLAILPVILYHIFESIMPGGYLGVDVFFVISGYLITYGIVKQISQGTFSIKNFYEKRIRRIIPAYFVLILFVLAITFTLANSDFFFNSIKVIFYSSIFVGNFYFANQVFDYFGLPTNSNPLLHLWSLAVEEQFYIFIPLFFILMKKCSVRIWLIVLITLFTFSFILSILPHFDLLSNKWSYYMLYSRAWELLAGSILAIATFSNGQASVSKLWGTTLAAGGMLIILIPCFLYSKFTPFPGHTALFPVVGAVLLLRYGSYGFIGKFLETRPLVFVGQLSYSLYLWHWVLVVYSKMIPVHIDDHIRGIFVLILSFMMAYLSWRFVEQPIRLYKSWSFKKALALFISSASICLIFTAPFIKLNSLLTYFYNKGTIQNINLRSPYILYTPYFQFPESTHSDSYNQKYGKDYIFLGDKKIATNAHYLLLGDSHALRFAWGLHQWGLKNGLYGYLVRSNITFGSICSSHKAPSHAEKLDQFINRLKQQPHISHVILAQWWEKKLFRSYQGPFSLEELKRNPPSSPEGAYVMSVLELCTRIHAAGKKIIIMSHSPVPASNMLNMHTIGQRTGYGNVRGIHKKSYLKNTKHLDELFAEIVSLTGAKVLCPHPLYFKNSEYANFYLDSQTPLLYDLCHITDKASELIIEYLTEDLSDAFGIKYKSAQDEITPQDSIMKAAPFP